MGVTLKQIAELAGVHKSTVDKVIHNRPGVSDAKRQQIKALLDEYGYESNPLAKALNYQKKKLRVAVVLPEVDAMPSLRAGMALVQQDFNSFNVEVVYDILPFDVGVQAPRLRRLREEGVSGVVILPIETPEVVQALEELRDVHIPVIAVNSDLQGKPYLCFVGQDMVQSGKVAARMAGLLLPQGGALGVISSANMRAVKQREQSFLQEISVLSANIQVKKLIHIEETAQSAYTSALALLRENPDIRALFITCGCVPDICRAVRDAGKLGELVIISYEQYPEIEALVRNGEIACTISGDLKEQGRLAMRLLFEHLIYDKLPAKTELYTKNEILIRENI